MGWWAARLSQILLISVKIWICSSLSFETAELIKKFIDAVIMIAVEVPISGLTERREPLRKAVSMPSAKDWRQTGSGKDSTSHNQITAVHFGLYD
jgi:hypothetical protein